MPRVYESQLRRSTRENRPSIKYTNSDYIRLTENGEPENFEKVQNHKKKAKRIEAMTEEVDSLMKNDTCDLVELPKGKRVLKNKWVYRLKNDGEEARFKARLVVKGFG